MSAWFSLCPVSCSLCCASCRVVESDLSYLELFQMMRFMQYVTSTRMIPVCNTWKECVNFLFSLFFPVFLPQFLFGFLFSSFLASLLFCLFVFSLRSSERTPYDVRMHTWCISIIIFVCLAHASILSRLLAARGVSLIVSFDVCVAFTRNRCFYPTTSVCNY